MRKVQLSLESCQRVLSVPITNRNEFDRGSPIILHHIIMIRRHREMYVVKEMMMAIWGQFQWTRDQSEQVRKLSHYNFGSCVRTCSSTTAQFVLGVLVGVSITTRNVFLI